MPPFAASFGPIGFGDGSGINCQNARTRRCGWSVCGHLALISTSDVFVGVRAFAPLLGLLQEVPLAEAFAFWFFLRHC